MLLTDTERLDWLIENGADLRGPNEEYPVWNVYWGKGWYASDRDLRQAIEKGIKVQIEWGKEGRKEEVVARSTEED